MVAEAQKIASISPNFVIKIPCCEQGYCAARTLELQGIRTNVTLVFSPAQAIQAGRIGAKFVSAFVAWKEEAGEDCRSYITDIVQIYRNYAFKTEIIVAALRNGKQIVDAARAGAHIVTASFEIYKASFDHAFTDRGIMIFSRAWDETVMD
jgi:transaldolase